MSGAPPPYSTDADYAGNASRWGGHKGYEPVPHEMEAYPPARDQHPSAPPPPTGYAPAPVVMPPMQQQQSSNNVVVVGQQPTAPAPVQTIHVEHRSANSHLALTLVLMVLCFLHGNIPAFIFLVPALICAVFASDHNSSGDYEGARSCGRFALCCNILSMTYFLLLIIAVVVLVALYFTVGLSFLPGLCSTTVEIDGNTVYAYDGKCRPPSSDCLLISDHYYICD